MAPPSPGWRGVYQSTARDSAGQPRWRVQATIDGKTAELGSFHSDVEAALCYARHVQGPKKRAEAKLAPVPKRDAASVRLLRVFDAVEPPDPSAAGQKR